MLRRLLLASIACSLGGCGSSGPSCDLPPSWSEANSGGLCQVNFFTSPEHAVYCSGSTGNWDCACGPVAENPIMFTSPDFCDIEGDERGCQAVEACGFEF